MRRSAGIPVALSPSVTPRLDRAMIGRIAASGVKAVSVSLDGATAATHDGHPRHPGPLRPDAVAAIAAAVGAGLPVQVNTTVMTRQRRPSWPEVAALLDRRRRATSGRSSSSSRPAGGAVERAGGTSEHEDVCHFLVDASRYGFDGADGRGAVLPTRRRRRVAARGRRGRAGFAVGPLYRALRGELGQRARRAVRGRARADARRPGTARASSSSRTTGTSSRSGSSRSRSATCASATSAEIYRDDPRARRDPRAREFQRPVRRAAPTPTSAGDRGPAPSRPPAIRWPRTRPARSSPHERRGSRARLPPRGSPARIELLRDGSPCLPAVPGLDSRVAGGLPVPRRPGPGHLCGQGQEPAGQAQLLLRRFRQPAPAHPVDAHLRGGGRLDGRGHRGRGAPAGVLLDQGVRPPVQRALPGRQELPLPRGHHGRGVPPGHGDAGRQAARDPLLRPVLPRLGHQGDR